MKHKRIKVAVGLSGGVDSSVAAALLKEKGYDVVGIFMQIFDGSMGVREAEKHACYGPGEEDDTEKAAGVCRQLGIPFHIIDLKKEYRRHVIHYFRREYLAGRTPNPCIACNHRLKFGFLLDKARKAGIDFELFSTGHYAQIEVSDGSCLLKRAADRSKDQTYFLYALTPEQLSRTLFPLGKYTKQQVRKIAASLGLETANLPESQDFIAGGNYSHLFNGGEVKRGDIIDEKGNILGKHKGIIHYTIGQRRGLGIASDRPLYVAKIDAEDNRIVVSGKDGLFSEGLIAKGINLISVERFDRQYKVKVKIRLQHTEVDATLLPHENGRAKVLFNHPQMSVAPGQSAVFYSDETVLGGGVIERAL
ncbi:MAG: tRNA 2-thiouridine(34) synthase MnmA [Thermodesulfobacteriota bacterium]|nr:tRNA 2-thiouridine(34) synthase MnmA [Thermodesulfobacteriota bacterium]